MLCFSENQLKAVIKCVRSNVYDICPSSTQYTFQMVLDFLTPAQDVCRGP